MDLGHLKERRKKNSFYFQHNNGDYYECDRILSTIYLNIFALFMVKARFFLS